jgi:hypothetical protein
VVGAYEQFMESGIGGGFAFTGSLPGLAEHVAGFLKILEISKRSDLPDRHKHSVFIMVDDVPIRAIL